MQRRKGVVSYFDERKGFGFVTDEEGRDVFVHYAEIQRDGFQTLSLGEQVLFDLAEGGNALRAVNVEVPKEKVGARRP
ncbi:MAG: cold shock domain-containing protein [Humidesulfovibrio sp.]|uniref:cold shock domain-containing protein n=1 Tax=Humidesulfovibrio sp. TaxID=2910988 RepID=UPI00273259C4|nr:cold shock domain-containing protein [Humidesulfovibrio sp.]MDP2846581.1 cold shock domain-containing protein [Humidesulfovibrio sp.]